MEKRQIRLFNIYPTAEGSYFVVLEEIDSRRKFGILTFQSEATYILSFFFSKKSPRPTIYEVFSNFLVHSEVLFSEAVLTQFEKNVYHAKLVCHLTSGEESTFDIRATDAIAMALLNHKPLYAAEEVITECSMKYGAIIDRLIEKSQGPKSLTEVMNASTLSSYEEQLKRAIEREDYELAARLKKEHDRQ